MYIHICIYMYMYIYIYIYIYIYVYPCVPTILLASRLRECLNRAALTCMFPWRARYPRSQCRKSCSRV